MGPKSRVDAAEQDLFRMELVNLIDQRSPLMLAATEAQPATSRVSDLTAGKPTHKLSGRIADVRGRQWPTQSCRRHFCGRATAALRKRSLVEHVKNSEPCDSGRSPGATADRDTIAAERLQPKVANWRCRPTPAGGDVEMLAVKQS